MTYHQIQGISRRNVSRVVFGWVITVIALCALLGGAMVAQAQPANDNLTSATVITAVPYTVNQSTVGATVEATETAGGCANNNSVWFRYTPTSNGTLNVNTCGSDYDTTVSVWTGMNHPLTEAACNDDSNDCGDGSTKSALSVAVMQGVTYYVRASVQEGIPSNLNFALNFTPAPRRTWSDRFGIPAGVNGTVFEIALDNNGNLYVGGDFTLAGNVVVNNIAKWNGTRWEPLGTGLNGNVYALAIDDTGNLYASGDFTAANGVPVENIAKWDGASWSALGSGSYHPIHDIAWDNVRHVLYETSGVFPGIITRWTGTKQETIGLTYGGDGTSVSALAVDNTGNLYVGGTFIAVEGVPAHNIAKWDGTGWSALGSGVEDNRGEESSVKAIVMDNAGNFYVGGIFNTAGGVSANHIAKWNGSEWEALGTGLNDQILALAVDSNGILYAAGQFYPHIAKWNDASWEPLGSGTDRLVFSLAVNSNGILYAGGDFDAANVYGAGEIVANGLAKWTDTAWAAVGSGEDGIRSEVMAFAVDDVGTLYAAGTFPSAGSVSNHIAKWDGVTWSGLGSASKVDEGSVEALAVDHAGNLYAGGNFYTGGGVSVNCIAKWDGLAWSALGSEADNCSSGTVQALAVDNSNILYVGGGFHTMGGIPAENLAKWNGTSWVPVGSGLNNTVDSLEWDSAGNLYAGGGFTDAGNHIARWNGTSWEPLGSGINGVVNALAWDATRNRLYAGGVFSIAGGVAAQNIAQWDGSQWTALGAGLNTEVKALTVDNTGILYAGGYFTTAGGSTASLIAQWNGSRWQPLESGISGSVAGGSYVSTLTTDAAGTLYAGGNFTNAGGVVSAYISAWGVPPAGSGSDIQVTQGIADIANGIGSFDFGEVQVGDRQTRNVVIRNPGDAPLTLTGTPVVRITGAHPDDFVVTDAPATTIAPNGLTSFTVTFLPHGGGVRNATITILNNDTRESPYIFTVTGSGQDTRVCAAQTQIPQDECTALTALYLSTAGATWTDSPGNNWTQTTTPCSWSGVTCSGGFVTAIDRSSQNLTGILPASLGNFTHLQHLRLNQNAGLTGTLPLNLMTLPLPGNSLNLPGLQQLYFDGTTLCEPGGAFQTWLTGITDVRRTAAACAATDYFVYTEYGGTWKDVESTGIPGPSPSGDDKLCWAFVAANVLDWTKWGVPGLDTNTAIANDYKAHWTNEGGMMRYAWRWWFDGTPPPKFGPGWTLLKDTSGGGYYAGEPFISEDFAMATGRDMMATVKEYLHRGYGVGIALYPSNLAGHALTVWGYQAYSDGTVTGLWVTDSRVGTPNTLRLLPVELTGVWEQQASGTVNHYDEKWRVADTPDGDPYRGWLIEGAQALKAHALNVLRIQNIGTGSGTVESAPAGIACGVDCVQTYPFGANVTLTATPSPGSRFVGWQGSACSGTGFCTVTMSGERLALAHFQAESSSAQTITVSGAHVTVSPESVLQVPAGGSATFAFKPDPEYRIADVRVDGRSIGEVSAYTFTNVTQDHVINVITSTKDAKMGLIVKKCLNANNQEIACPESRSGTIMVGEYECDSECMKLMVVYAKENGLVLRFVPDAETTFFGWQREDGTLIEGTTYVTSDDLLIKPVIQCRGSGS